jgi:hypothetical protein
MKSSIFILPFIGLTLAQECGPRSIVTETATERVTVTVPAASSSKAAVTTIHRPTFSHPPFVNGTSSNSNSTRLPTYKPVHSTKLRTVGSGLPTSSLASTLAFSSSSSSSKSAKTVVVSSVPVASSTEGTKTASAPVAASTLSPSVDASTSPATSPVEQVNSAAAVKGSATFYGGNTSGGHCSFAGYTIPSGLFGTAFGGSWDASKCGSCVSVTGPNGKSVKAMVNKTTPNLT